MSTKLEQATKEMKKYRSEIIDKLMQYSASDMLLFWGANKELIERQEKQWGPLLKWAAKEFDGEFKKTHSLAIDEDSQKTGYRIKAFLERLNDKELAGYYMAALNMRSVLLAAALVKGRINAEEAYKAAYLEQLFQEETWGKDEEASSKLAERKEELVQIEKYLQK